MDGEADQNYSFPKEMILSRMHFDIRKLDEVGYYLCGVRIFESSQN